MNPKRIERPWLKPRLAAGQFALGSFVDTPHPALCEALAALGFDYLIVDGEHAALDVSLMQSMIRACEAAGVPALARVPGTDTAHIAYALDSGAAGVLVPRVNSAAEAAAVASASRYPPEGARGMGPGRAARYGLDMAAYVAEARAHTLVAIQIESRPAVDALDDILKVPGIDMIFVGPADLASSLGLAGPTDPALRPLIEDILERARAAGRLTGIFAPTPVLAARWRQRGVHLVALSTDLLLLASGVRAALAEFEAALKARGGVDRLAGKRIQPGKSS